MAPTKQNTNRQYPLLEKAPEKPKPHKHRQLGAATIGLIIGVAGLAAGRLGYLYPHFDVFSEFSVQSIALVLAFTFAVFMPRYKALIGIVLTLFLIVIYGIWPHVVSVPLQQGPYALAPAERALRVAHFNTFLRNKNIDAIDPT